MIEILFSKTKKLQIIPLHINISKNRLIQKNSLFVFISIFLRMHLTYPTLHLRIQIFYQTAIFPKTFPFFLPLFLESPSSILLPIFPIPLIDPSTWPCEFPIAVFSVFVIFSFVLFSVMPGICALAMHLVVFSFAIVLSIIRSYYLSFPM